MEELEQTLLRMRNISERMAKAAQRIDEGRNAQIVSLRQEFSEECGNFLKGLPSTLHLGETADLFQQLQSTLETVRTRLFGHQAKWSLKAISEDHDAYVAANKLMHISLETFIDGSLDALAQDKVLRQENLDAVP